MNDFNLQTQVEKCIQLYSDISGADILKISEQVQSGKFSFSGTLSQYEFTTRIRKTLGYYQKGELECAYFEIIELLRFALGQSSFRSPDEAKVLSNRLSVLTELWETFLQWKESTHDVAIREDLKNIHLKCDYNFDCRDILKLKESIGSQYLKLYSYRTSGVKPKIGNLRIKDSIVATDSIETLTNIGDSKDCWNVQIGLFIERKIDLSYFMFVLENNGNVFILTDKPQYANPDQIDRLRGGGRRFSEDRENALFLPYALIDRVIENRNNKTTLTKNSGQELWTFSVSSYFDWNLYYLLKFTIEKVMTSEVTPLMESCQLAIGCPEIDMTDDSSFEYITEEGDSLVKELALSTTLPAIRSSEFLEQLPMLSTKESFIKDVTYLAHKKVVEEQERLKYGDIPHDWRWTDSLHNKFREERNQFLSLVQGKLESLYPIIFSGKNVKMYDVDKPLKQGRDYNYFACTSSGLVLDVVGELRNYRYICLMDNKTPIRKFFRKLTFLRFTEMMAFLGIDREELPPMFRCYIAHPYMPYFGNFILHNIKPEYVAIEQDFMSRVYSNGFLVSIAICGNCMRKLYHKYSVGETSVVVISSKQNKVLDIKNMETFNTEDYE